MKISQLRDRLRYWLEGPAMNRTGSMCRELLYVLFGTVAFVREKVVAGIETVILDHETISSHFCHD